MILWSQAYNYNCCSYNWCFRFAWKRSKTSGNKNQINHRNWRCFHIFFEVEFKGLHLPILVGFTNQIICILYFSHDEMKGISQKKKKKKQNERNVYEYEAIYIHTFVKLNMFCLNVRLRPHFTSYAISHSMWIWKLKRKVKCVENGIEMDIFMINSVPLLIQYMWSRKIASHEKKLVAMCVYVMHTCSKKSKKKERYTPSVCEYT